MTLGTEGEVNSFSALDGFGIARFQGGLQIIRPLSPIIHFTA